LNFIFLLSYCNTLEILFSNLVFSACSRSRSAFSLISLNVYVSRIRTAVNADGFYRRFLLKRSRKKTNPSQIFACLEKIEFKKNFESILRCLMYFQVRTKSCAGKQVKSKLYDFDFSTKKSHPTVRTRRISKTISCTRVYLLALDRVR